MRFSRENISWKTTVRGSLKVTSYLRDASRITALVTAGLFCSIAWIGLLLARVDGQPFLRVGLTLAFAIARYDGSDSLRLLLDGEPGVPPPMNCQSR